MRVISWQCLIWSKSSQTHLHETQIRFGSDTQAREDKGSLTGRLHVIKEERSGTRIAYRVRSMEPMGEMFLERLNWKCTVGGNWLSW
jgi:hypothetical protein